MARYIELDALIAEVESKIEKYTKRGEESDAKCDGYGMYWGGVISCLNEVRTLCDTLEVKEVNLKEEVDKIWKPRFSLGWDDKSLLSVSYKGFEEIAKHFFELGLKAQKGEQYDSNKRKESV